MGDRTEVSNMTGTYEFSYASSFLLACPGCEFGAQYYDSPDVHKWAKRFVCRCGRDWLVCTVCSKQRTHLITPQQIARHAQKCIYQWEAGVILYRKYGETDLDDTAVEI